MGEPSIVIVPEPSTKLKESRKSVEIPTNMNENSEQEIAPPSPYANNNDMKDDIIISALEKDSDDFVQVSDEEKEDNEEKDDEEEEVEGPETPAESISVEVIIADEEDNKPTKILKDVEESANLIDDDFYPSFRPSIDCDVLNSVIVEENDEDMQSLSSSITTSPSRNAGLIIEDFS